LLQENEIVLADSLVGRCDIAELDRFVKNEYWLRAWITQEIVSAQDFFFFAGTEMLSIATFTSKGQELISEHADQWRRVLWQPTMVLRQQRDEPTLLENLWHFQHKDCLLVRDKIYSLLSVSQHGHNVAVDYSTSDIKVALDLFRQEPSFCLCQAQFVLKALDIRYIVRNHGLGELDDDANVPSFVELRARALPPGPFTCLVCGDAIEVETEHMLTSPSVQNLYAYCLSCSHSVEAPLQYFVHGHIILARGYPETAAGGKVTKWWIFLQ
jgi:hypothetical protein